MRSAVFALSLLTGGLGSVILFAILSFFALREFITLTPTRPADHSALFWVFFIILPLQYHLVVGLQLCGVRLGHPAPAGETFFVPEGARSVAQP